MGKDGIEMSFTGVDVEFGFASLIYMFVSEREEEDKIFLRRCGPPRVCKLGVRLGLDVLQRENFNIYKLNLMDT